MLAHHGAEVEVQFLHDGGIDETDEKVADHLFIRKELLVSFILISHVRIIDAMKGFGKARWSGIRGSGRTSCTQRRERFAAVDRVAALPKPDFSMMKELLKTPTIFDGRNQYSSPAMKPMGFEYVCVGRG